MEKENKKTQEGDGQQAGRGAEQLRGITLAGATLPLENFQDGGCWPRADRELAIFVFADWSIDPVLACLWQADSGVGSRRS